MPWDQKRRDIETIQVHSMQPGPNYLLTPRKCGLFGVCCEGIPQQVNYLIDEGMSSSKGSSTVINYLHHFFTSYGVATDQAVPALQLRCSGTWCCCRQGAFGLSNADILPPINGLPVQAPGQDTARKMYMDITCPAPKSRGGQKQALRI